MAAPKIWSEFEISQNSEENTCARASDTGYKPVILQALVQRDFQHRCFQQT